MSEAFEQAKERRDKGAQDEVSRIRYGKEERGDTNGWNEEDHEIFIDEANKDEWTMDDNFLDKVQAKLPYMLHSEIIDHRKWVTGQDGNSKEERRMLQQDRRQMKVRRTRKRRAAQMTKKEPSKGSVYSRRKQGRTSRKIAGNRAGAKLDW